MRSGPMQADMTQHFADESQHAAYWTKCIGDLGMHPSKLKGAYQDQYLEAGGLPVNMIEILAVTLDFERRVVGQYVAHSKVPELKPAIGDTLSKIMNDERWHISWVSDALKALEADYGKEPVMSHTTVEAIKARISATLQIPVAKPKDDARVTDIVTESFAIVEMVIDLQEEFGIRLGQEDLKAIQTIGALASLIEERTKRVA
jgi:acyl carrier protein